MRAYMRKEMFWRTLIVAICALVFFFALHAKTSMYDSTGVKVTPSTASKLWLNSHKIEIPSQQPNSGLLFCIALLSLFVLYLERDRQRCEALSIQGPSNLPLQYLHRFLRPPPVLN